MKPLAESAAGLSWGRKRIGRYALVKIKKQALRRGFGDWTDFAEVRPGKRVANIPG